MWKIRASGSTGKIWRCIKIARIIGWRSKSKIEQLAAALNVSREAIGKRLRPMGVIQKEGKWILHDLTERSIEKWLMTCEILLRRQKRKLFLHRTVTGDEKWIYFDNPKHKKVCRKKGETLPPISRRDWSMKILWLKSGWSSHISPWFTLATEVRRLDCFEGYSMFSPPNPSVARKMTKSYKERWTKLWSK